MIFEKCTNSPNETKFPATIAYIQFHSMHRFMFTCRFLFGCCCFSCAETDLSFLFGLFVCVCCCFFLCDLFALAFPLSHDSKFNSSLSKYLLFKWYLKEHQKKTQTENNATTTSTLNTNGIWFLSRDSAEVILLVYIWVIFNGNSKCRVQKTFIVHVTKKRGTHDWNEKKIYIFNRVHVHSVCFAFCIIFLLASHSFIRTRILVFIRHRCVHTHTHNDKIKTVSSCLFDRRWSERRAIAFARSMAARFWCARGALFDVYCSSSSSHTHTHHGER